MQPGLYDELRKAVSDDRLKAYHNNNTLGDNRKVFASYIWNAALSESLCPLLHVLEITLRNSINDAAVAVFGERWFDDLFKSNERATLTKLKVYLHVETLTPGQFISGVTLGLWVSLFFSRYEQVLWPRLLKNVLPHMPRRSRTRQNVYARIEKIRNLRNRIYHYEPIFHWKDIYQQHDEILETIGWLNRPMLDVAKMLDRFPEVYSRGTQGYENSLVGLEQ